MRVIRWLTRRLWLVALVAALALTAADAMSRIRRAEHVSSCPGEMADPPASDPASPTGYDLGRRMLILSVGEDGLQWIMQTQAMLAGGDSRIHHVDYDNAPAGRETHWASPLRWLLAALALVKHAVSGQPLGAAVEWAALYANPLMLGLLLACLIPFVARRFGSAAAVVLSIGIAAAYPFNVYFAADFSDHHGILEACGMLTVILLLAGGGGLVRARDSADPKPAAEGREAVDWLPAPRSARLWFAASAVVGGIGLWVSAASQIPILAGIGIGALGSAWIGRADPDGAWRRQPELWRLWGIVGGATSLAAYLAEYFPSHFGFRLEVNHPLYAFAWLGAGELLCRCFRIWGPDGFRPSRREIVPAMAAAAAIAVAPVFILLTKDRSFLVANRFVWMLGTHYVAEGESLPHFLMRFGTSLRAIAHFLPLLLVVPPAWFIIRWRGARIWKAQVALALAPALLFLGLTVREIRWWGLEEGLAFAALAPMFAALSQARESRLLLRWTAAGCCALLLSGVWALLFNATLPLGASQEEVRRLEERDIAHWLRLRAGSDPVVVAGTPTLTNHLIYYGGCRGLGTLYWENTEGFEHAAEIFSARSVEEAHTLVRRFGVTHIVLLSWDDFAEDLVRFYRDVPAAEPTPTDTFLQVLRNGGVPHWLRRLPYRMPKIKPLEGQFALVLEVVPEQSPAAATARLMDYLLEMDQIGSAVQTAHLLEQYPFDLRALVALACFQGQTGRAEAFAVTLDWVADALPKSADFNAEERIRLAMVLAAGRRTELARAQLARIMEHLDERALRQLTPGRLRDLRELTDILGGEIPDARLRRLALSLYPPMFRGASQPAGK